MDPLYTSAIIFFCVFCSAILGAWLNSVLPEGHLTAETKELIKLGVGLIGTMAALLLGLLVASAKSSYDLRSSELTEMAADTVLLDRSLAHYGPQAGEIRGTLKIAVGNMIEQVWSDRIGSSPQSHGSLETVYDGLQRLTPQTDAQRALQSQAESVVMTLGHARLLIFAQEGTSISVPFLVVVTFWLSVLFISFGLFTPRNPTAVVVLLVAAISVAAALFLILELDQPFSGLVQLSSAPLRNALAVLGR